MTATTLISAHAPCSNRVALTSDGLRHDDMCSDTGSTHYDAISANRHVVVFFANQTINYAECDMLYTDHGFSSIGCILQGFEHTNNWIDIIVDINAISTISAADGIIFVSSNFVNSTTQLHNTTPTMGHMIIETTANGIKAILGNDDSICIPFNDHTARVVSDYITANYDLTLMPGINACCNDNTNNTHVDVGHNILPYVATYDYGEISRYYSCAFKFVSNSWLNDDITRTCGSLSGNEAVVKDQYEETNVQSWMMDRVQQGTNNNTMHDDEMENCYLLGMKVCYVPSQTMTRRLGRIGSSHTIETPTTHGELESRVCRSAGRRGLDTIFELWKKHMHNNLIGWMTKAYRRGVTCTEEYGFAWHPFCTLICSEVLFLSGN